MLPDFSVYNAIGTTVFVLTETEAGRIEYAFMNAAGCRHLLCSMREVVGKTALELFSGRMAQNVYERQVAAWEAGAETSYEIPLPIGSDTLWVLTKLVPQRDETGKVTHMVGISQDITREKLLEQSEAMTHAVVSEMEDFVSFAAHDLRSPIANVKMLTDALREGFVDMGDGKTEIIGMIEDIAERALSLVSDMLIQTTAVRRPAPPEAFDFRRMCANALVTLDPAQQHSVTIADAAVEADMQAIQIIVRNLMDNALKHADRESVSLKVDVAQHDEVMLAITISDNGKGFDDAALGFLQNDAAAPMKGFGLVGVRRLVRARGGHIVVPATEPGSGACIEVYLPGQVIPDDAEEAIVA